MVKFEEWLNGFLKDKKEINAESSPDIVAHDLRRFIDENSRIWEIAITYTDRLVVRQGAFEPDGVTVKWSHWNTMHEVKITKNR